MRDSAKSLSGQRVEEMIRSPTESAERRKCLYRESKTCLHASHCMRVVCSGEGEDCAVLRLVSVVAPKMLRHTALDKNLNEVKKQKHRDSRELAKKNMKLKHKLEAARDRAPRL